MSYRLCYGNTIKLVPFSSSSFSLFYYFCTRCRWNDDSHRLKLDNKVKTPRSYFNHQKYNSLSTFFSLVRSLGLAFSFILNANDLQTIESSFVREYMYLFPFIGFAARAMRVYHSGLLFLFLLLLLLFFFVVVGVVYYNLLLSICPWYHPNIQHEPNSSSIRSSSFAFSFSSTKSFFFWIYTIAWQLKRQKFCTRYFYWKAVKW